MDKVNDMIITFGRKKNCFSNKQEKCIYTRICTRVEQLAILCTRVHATHVSSSTCETTNKQGHARWLLPRKLAVLHSLQIPHKLSIFKYVKVSIRRLHMFTKK